MKCLILIVAILMSIYLLNFAKFNWDYDNKRAAIGAMIIAIASIATSLFSMQ